MLDVDGLTVRYGATLAVDDVDLHVVEGEVVVLLGPSGCGKSTILRSVAGLVPVNGGRISLGGRDLAGVPPEQRGVGLMFQDYALFPHRDVAGNVAFGPRMQRRSRAEVAARVEEVLALVDLDGYGHRSVASLSGGEQQRVALARALAPSPRLLMLDEPLGSLDRALREQLTVELRQLFTRLGVTAVTVTHDQGEAFTLGDRVVLLRGGRIVQEGRPLDVWRRPADAFAARFLGFANVFDVTVVGGHASTPWGDLLAARPDGPAALVLRPDALRLVESGRTAGRGGTVGSAVATGIVGPAGFRGDHFLVPVDLAGGPRVEVVDRSGAVPPTGATIGVALDPSGCVFVPV